jgi:FkbM family methyltransferase
MINIAPQFPGPMSAPPECEGSSFRIKRPCKSFDGAFFCGMEWDEWNIVRGLVRRNNVVLELGGRFGTTSCVLSEQTGNAGNVVTVEPDPKAHKALLRNRQRHNCSFHIVRGTVGDTPSSISQTYSHYATQTRPAAAGDVAVPNIAFKSVEQLIGKKFDTLLIDCEGCIDDFFSGTNRKLLSQVTLIIMEEDAPYKVNYRKWHNRFRRYGFERVWRVRDSFDPAASWSQNISHSAWRRGGLGGLPSCTEHAHSANLSRRWLNCMEPEGIEPMVPGCSTDPCFTKA